MNPAAPIPSPADEAEVTEACAEIKETIVMDAPKVNGARATVRLDNVDLDLEDSAEITPAHVKALLAQTRRKANGYTKKTRCAFTSDSAVFRTKKRKT